MLTVYLNENAYMPLTTNHCFLELAVHLRDKLGANIVHHKAQTNPPKVDPMIIEKLEIEINDPEVLIHDEDNDVLRGISFAEGGKTSQHVKYYRSMTDLFISRDNEKDILMITNQNEWIPYYPDVLPVEKNPYNFNIKPTTWYTFYSKIEYDWWYQQRKLRWFDQNSHDGLIDKMFHRCGRRGEQVEMLAEQGLTYPENMNNLTPLELYLDEAIKCKLGLAIPGIAEVTFREFDYFAIGLPMIHIEYINQLDPPLIPNHHYVSVDRDNLPLEARNDHNMLMRGGLTLEGGEQEFIDAYKNRFLEVKDDYDFLSFVAQNAYDYYREYCRPETRLKHILNSLELNE